MTTERRVRWILAAAAVLCLARPGPARGGEQSGLTLGARAGYGIPLGDAMSGVSLGDLVSGQVPLQLEAGWRLDPSWRLGLYARYGFASIAGASCPAGASCSGQNLGLGAEAVYAFGADRIRPWVGAGLGVEWQTAKVAGNELRLFGLELLNLQAGVDFRPSAPVGIGPFASFSLGQYLTAASGGVRRDLTTAMHQWVQLGVRGAFDL